MRSGGEVNFWQAAMGAHMEKQPARGSREGNRIWYDVAAFPFSPPGRRWPEGSDEGDRSAFRVCATPSSRCRDLFPIGGKQQEAAFEFHMQWPSRIARERIARGHRGSSAGSCAPISYACSARLTTNRNHQSNRAILDSRSISNEQGGRRTSKKRRLATRKNRICRLLARVMAHPPGNAEVLSPR